MYLYCSSIVLLLSQGSCSRLDMNLRVSFKDDILEIDINECGHWGHGPIWNKCTSV